jgi:predicted ATP-dependent endonuclease of OLD family
MSFSASIRNELLQSAIIPSFRDPQNQLRAVGWGWYGKLMKYLTTTHGKDNELKNAFDSVKKIADQIFDEAKSKIEDSSLKVAFPNATIHFQFNEDFKSDVYKDSKIYIDDGIKTPLSEKGSGIQSATIIGLFSFYTQRVNTKTSALLCIEEPELYLHPHARRVISDRLDSFLSNNKNQVILTTHSSEFIRTTDEALNIILVKKENGETTADPIGIKRNRYLLLDNNYNELFFSDKVIVCEGYDSYILRWIINEKFPGKLDELNISLITVGGKDNIDEFVQMIVYLGIQCFVLTDFDYLLRDKSESADQYEGSNKHESVVSLGESFFKQDCIFGSKWEDNVKKIKQVRQKIKTRQEKKFYTAKNINEIDDPKQECLKLLEDLRNNGICILNGEIEDVFVDNSLTNGNKISLNEIFKVNKYLSENQYTISKVVNTSEFEDFIKHVFN